jgi:hypothetical protein
MRRSCWLAVVALVVPGVAEAGPPTARTAGCDGRPPDAPAERLAGAIRFREDFTLRSDPAFVARVQASPTARARGDRRGFPPITPSEDRYFRERDRVQEAASRIDGFLRERRATDGGLSIEDDFPRGAYLLVRLAEPRPERHLPTLRRRAGVRVRVRRVRWSERHLRRVQRRVDALFARPPRDVTVGATYPDLDRNRVVVEVATRRTDVQQELTRRFGPAVHVDVLAADATIEVCTSPDSVGGGDDPHELRLHWSGSGSTPRARAFVEETADTVRVGVLVTVPTVGGLTLDLVLRTETVRLAAPLGDRRLVDAETGRTLRVTAQR